MSRSGKLALIAGVICSCLVLVTAAAKIAGDAFGRRPFRMTVRPVDGHSVVQFAQPDRGLSSPEFPADLVIEQAHSVDLRSGQVAVPGCRVEFYDTTILPGRFRLWVGRTHFDVMQRGIIVGGEEHDWRQ
jgi:hypothetical protein